MHCLPRAPATLARRFKSNSGQPAKSPLLVVFLRELDVDVRLHFGFRAELVCLFCLGFFFFQYFADIVETPS